MKKVMALCSLVLWFAGVVSAQSSTFLGSTTLSTAIAWGSPSNAPNASAAVVPIYPASLTGITGMLNGQPTTRLYIDGEEFAVVSVSTAAGNVTVQRGQDGTKSLAHAAGAIVLIQNFPSQTGGTPQMLGGFQQGDPPFRGACVISNQLVTPWVNVTTGAKWICSSVTNTWTPAWDNPLAGDFSLPTAAVASVAGATLPSGPLFHVTGTNAITGWTLPIGFTSGCITTIPDSGVWTWTAAGNIAVAGTVTTANGVPVTFCYDPNTAKWYPSRVS